MFQKGLQDALNGKIDLQNSDEEYLKGTIEGERRWAKFIAFKWDYRLQTSTVPPGLAKWQPMAMTAAQ